MADEFKELAATIFAEAYKQAGIEEFTNDGIGVGSVIRNRVGDTGDYLSVINAPAQFSGVGSEEYMKFMSGNLTDDEQEFAKKAMQIARGIVSGTIEDTTNGADHYYNPELASPEWGELRDEKSVNVGGVYYPQTHQTMKHSFHKATERWGQRRKNIAQQQQALKDKGFDVGDIDGIIGPRTTQAAKDFQQSVGLKVDGKIGPKTKKALFKSE